MILQLSVFYQKKQFKEYPLGKSKMVWNCDKTSLNEKRKTSRLSFFFTLIIINMFYRRYIFNFYSVFTLLFR